MICKSYPSEGSIVIVIVSPERAELPDTPFPLSETFAFSESIFIS